MNKKEEWKNVPDYEGFYQASSFGNVRSLDREIKHSTSNGYYTKKGIILKQSIRIDYLQICLSKNNKHKRILTHVLIAIVFHNHIPNGRKLVVNHIDLNKLNNHKDNIEVVTHRVNCNKLHIKSTSKYIGVYWDKNCNKWRAKISIDRKNKHLGSFDVEYEAHLAYQKALNNHLKKNLCCG